MKGKKLLATLALATILFTGCGIKNQNAIIKINDKAITQAEFDKQMDKAISMSPLAAMGDLKANKDGFLYLMTSQQVINQMILTELMDQEANERGIKVTNKDVDEALKEIIDQMGGKERLMETLKANGVSVSDFKKDLKTQVKMKKLADSTGNTQVSDKDVEKFYKENPDKFKYPEQVRASHILIGANPYQLQMELTNNGKKKIETEELKKQIEKKIAEKEALAQKLDKELKADPSKFAAYAKKYSEDEASAKQGGDLGFFAKEQMVPEFGEVAFKSKPNTVSDVVKTQFGYHIIMVQDRKAAGSTSFEKAKTNIKEFLTRDKQIGALDELATAAKKKAKIEYSEDRYNPEEIQKKLTTQVNDMTGGQAQKVKEQSKKK